MLTERYRDALALTFELHQRQERKGSGVPYVAHVLGVSSLVLEHGGDEDEAIAALLHDAVEDQGGAATLARIAAGFGARVADIVRGCSDSMGEPKPPWRERKEHYLAHLGSASTSVRLVSSCDKLYNARTILADLRAGAPVADSPAAATAASGTTACSPRRSRARRSATSSGASSPSCTRSGSRVSGRRTMSGDWNGIRTSAWMAP